MPNNDLKTLNILYSLLCEEPTLPPKVESSLTSLADQIDASDYNIKNIAKLIAKWVRENEEIASSFYEKLNKLNNPQEADRFFFGAKEPKQDPQSLYREKITELINKMRDRQPPDNPNSKGKEAHAP